MKELTIKGLMNHISTIKSMVAHELEQKRKHEANARCKPANWGVIANYIEYGFGIKTTAEEVYEEVHSFNF